MSQQQHLVGLHWTQATGLQASKKDLLENFLQQETASKVWLQGVTYSSIILYDNLTKTLRTTAVISKDPKSSEPVLIPIEGDKGITRRAFNERRPIIVSNVLNDQWRDLYVIGDSQTRSEMDAPLLDGERALGVINFESTQVDAFSSADHSNLVSIAEQATKIIKQAEEQLQTQRRELVQVINSQIASTLDLKQILRIILHAASIHLPAYFKSTVRLFDAYTRALRVAAVYSNDPSFSETFSISLNQDKGITCWAFRNKSPAHVDNVRLDPRWRDLFLESPGFQSLSELDVPLLNGEEAIGVINFESTEEAAFSPDDRIFLEELAKQAVIAIKKANKHQGTVQESTLFQAANLQISGMLDQKQILQKILRAACRSLPTAFEGDIVLFDKISQTLRTAAFYSRSDPSATVERVIDLNGERGITRWAFLNKRPALVGNVQTDPEWHDLFLEIPGFPSVSELCVPLLDEEEAIGVMNFESPKEGAFSLNDQAFLVEVAKQVVLAVNNARQLQEQVQKSAFHQTLNLQNTRALDLKQMRQTILQAARILDRKEILQAILQAAFTYLTSAIGGDILLSNADAHTLTTEAFYRNAGPTVTRIRSIDLNGERGITRWVFLNKCSAHIDNVRTDPEWRDLFIEMPGLSSVSELCVPLLDGEEAIGVVNFESLKEAAFTTDDRAFVELLSELVVLTIKTAKEIAFQEQIDFDTMLSKWPPASSSLDAHTLKDTPHPTSDLRLKYLLVGMIPILLLLGSIPLLELVAPQAIILVSALLLGTALYLWWIRSHGSQRLIVEIKSTSQPKENGL